MSLTSFAYGFYDRTRLSFEEKQEGKTQQLYSYCCKKTTINSNFRETTFLINDSNTPIDNPTSRHPTVLNFDVRRRVGEFALQIGPGTLAPLKFAAHFQLQPPRVFDVQNATHQTVGRRRRRQISGRRLRY
uniref:Uncharacterized protein n=1 Tax=Romanomermis culicivorax TaxID=13658 RepID=A0A915JJ97_ROMCU